MQFIQEDKRRIWTITVHEIENRKKESEMKEKYKLYYQQLGLNIAYYRKLRRMTQLDLAEFTDMSRTHISNIEAPNMKTSLSLDSLFTIAEVLQVAPKELLDFRIDLEDAKK